MLKEPWLLGVLALAYLGFAQVLSTALSNGPLCMLVSQYQPANNESGNQSCATLFEGIMRGLSFLWDNVNATNVAAAATIVIAVFTLTLWRSTDELQKITRITTEHTPLIERAYISGGGPTSDTGTDFRVQVNNYGKTPGELLSIQIGFCELTSIPPRPIYTANIPFRDYLPPGLRSRDIISIGIPPNLVRPVVFGRFHFRDIFGKRRSSGFILAIVRNPPNTVPINAPAPYTDETEETDA